MSAIAPERRTWISPDVLAMTALTLVALGLRIPALTQSLTLDEPHTYVMATGSLGDVFSELRAGYEIHPPLFFVLAWAAAQVGDPTVWVRVPSFLLGTAVVPLTYLLGLRTVGRLAAGIGAAIVAVSPFAVRYSTDARPYATLMFFAVLSSLLLLWAARSERRLAWILYVPAACALVYTHYFGAFVLIAQAVWALWACRDRLRAPLIAYAAVAVGFLPWLPSFLDQPHSTSDYAAVVPLKLRWLADESLGLFPGSGFYPWREIPGRSLTFVLIGALALAVVAAALHLNARTGEWRRPSDGVLLLAALALITPLGLLVFSVGGDNVWLSRYLGPALPALALLIGWMLASLPRPAALGAAALAVAVLTAGTVEGFGDDYRRAGYKDAAGFIEDRATPRDVVVEFFLSAQAADKKFKYVSPIDLNFDDEHRTVVASLESAQGVFRNPPAGGRVFVAGIEAGFFRLPRPLPEDRLRVVEQRVFAGDSPVAVYVYEPQSGL